MRDFARALGITSCWWCGSGRAWERPWVALVAGAALGLTASCAMTSHRAYYVAGMFQGAFLGAVAGATIVEYEQKGAAARRRN